MQSSVAAWIMPATGDCAPERMLVAVRAIAPVAGNPPNMGEKMLATPCPINSTFGLWRALRLRAGTTAGQSGSVGARRAGAQGGPAHAGRKALGDAGVRRVEH